MLGGIKKYPYLCSAKKERDGLCHQRTKTLAGHRALSEFAKKETLRIVPQQFLTIKRDTVQLTYPRCILTNDYKSSTRDIVEFYNLRGGKERILDVMIN